ncbi:MAG TPA: hypothetical protein VD969_26690 [Symbiobacteriaceae bacterium]|nr:hypothetical protein [Symbiobacteriaceae bacterium]
MTALGPLLVAASLALTAVVPAPIAWPTYTTKPGPGGFATVTIDFPLHGGQVQGPDTSIRLRTDNPGAALRVQIDGKDVDRNGLPHSATALSESDYPQWEFTDSRGLAVPVRGLAPGLHELIVRSGGIGTSLPRVNEQKITFMVK